jgi:hypothetical protein
MRNRTEGTYSPSIFEESYEELHMLLREALADAPDNRIVIASGDDLFTEQGECLYGN